jgi:hypothetical protein
MCDNSDEAEVVVHSNDAFAPVAYIRFKKVHLEVKTTKDPLDVTPQDEDLLDNALVLPNPTPVSREK